MTWKLFCFAVFLTLQINLNAQNAEPLNLRTTRPFGFGLNALGPTVFASANIDYFVTRNFSLELGGGLFGVYGGSRFYFGKKTWKGMPYTGIGYSRVFTNDDDGDIKFIYMPIGYQFITKKGLDFSLQGMLVKDGGSQITVGLPQLRIGYRFLSKKYR